MIKQHWDIPKVITNQK